MRLTIIWHGPKSLLYGEYSAVDSGAYLGRLKLPSVRSEISVSTRLRFSFALDGGFDWTAFRTLSLSKSTIDLEEMFSPDLFSSYSSISAESPSYCVEACFTSQDCSDSFLGKFARTKLTCEMMSGILRYGIEIKVPMRLSILESPRRWLAVGQTV